MASFYATVRDYDKTLFAGEVSSVSAHNSEGPFDILDEHTNFISIIDIELVLRLPAGQEKRWPVQSGVIRCFDRQVEVYLVATPSK